VGLRGPERLRILARMSEPHPTDPGAGEPRFTPGDLATDTAIAAVTGEPGLYAARMPDRWSFREPSGGVLTTVVLRAMAAELGDAELRPLSSTTLFCAPVPAGPLDVQVEVLRRGGAAAQLRARLGHAGHAGPGLEVLATFARARDGLDLQGSAFPAVPAPGDAEPLADDLPNNPHTHYRFFGNFEVRAGEGPRWWRGDWQAGPARHARWWRYRVAQRHADGTLDPLALPPLVDTMPPALITAAGPREQRFRAPSLDLTIHFLDRAATDWVLVRSFGRRAHAGYASCDVELWSEDRRLLAYGTQTMMLRRNKTTAGTGSTPSTSRDR